VADHPELVDINFGISFGEADWWHSNSISYSPELDQIIISNRNLDEFVIIDHSTTTAEAATNSGGNSNMGGDILYRWGNPQSYRQGTAADQVLFGQHDIQFVPAGLPNAGKIMMFNNGNDLTFTSVQYITTPFNTTTQNYDYNGVAFGPSTIDSQYVDPTNPDNFHATFLSGSQQLSNGNILICHGPNGTIFEVDSNSNTVWEYQSPIANTSVLSDGDDPSQSQTRMFRALRYDPNYPAFIGRDLTPSGVLEQNPVNDNCNILSVNDLSLENAITVFPTVVDDIITINSIETDIKTSFYDLNGRLISNHESTSTIDISNFKPGLYILHISSGTKKIYKKIIKK